MQQCVGVQVPMPAPPRRGEVRSASFPATAYGYCRKLRSLPFPSFQIRSTWLRICFFRIFCKVRSASFPATAYGYCRKLRSLPCASFQIRSTRLRICFFASSAKSAQLRFRQQPKAIAENCVRSLAPPSKSEALGFGFVFSLLFTDLSEDKQSIVSLLTAVLGAALVKKHDFLATTQRARVVDIILQAEHSSRMVETRKYSKA